jgi:hypothetical protein
LDRHKKKSYILDYWLISGFELALPPGHDPDDFWTYSELLIDGCSVPEDKNKKIYKEGRYPFWDLADCADNLYLQKDLSI